MESTAPAVHRVPERWWPIAGLVVGALAMLPHFANPLNTSETDEIADHVIPGIVVIVVSVVALVVLRRAVGPTFMFAAGLTVVLAGLWMFATHVPLLAQANRDEVDWGGALYHSGSGLLVLVFGIAWTATHWNDL